MNIIYARLIDNVGHTFELTAPVTNLGRAPDNQIIIDNEKCSRHHALITIISGRYTISDLGSKNGIWVNNEFVQKERILTNGDTIIVGGVQFKFEDLAPTLTETASQQPTSVTLQIDVAKMLVRLKGQTLNPPLTPSEWRLLLVLYQKAGEICSDEQIIQAVYQTDEPQSYNLETLVSRLRARLKSDSSGQTPHIVRMRGFGYRLDL